MSWFHSLFRRTPPPDPAEVLADVRETIDATRLPALALPMGFTANGLPNAFQLVGRPFDEATLFRAGAAYERETGFSRHAPPAS